MMSKPEPAPQAGARLKESSGSTIFSERAWTKIARHLRLSRREFQIVRGVFDDRTEFNIASSLGISTHTVHTHVERLHRKLGVADRIELVLRVTDLFLQLTKAPGSTMPPICANRTAGRCPLLRGQSRKPHA